MFGKLSVNNMEQTVIQIGNSIGVVIPQVLQKGNSIKVGDKIIVEIEPVSKAFIVRKRGSVRPSSITPEFLSIVDRVNKRYGRALQELAGK